MAAEKTCSASPVIWYPQHWLIFAVRRFRASSDSAFGGGGPTESLVLFITVSDSEHSGIDKDESLRALGRSILWF